MSIPDVLLREIEGLPTGMIYRLVVKHAEHHQQTNSGGKNYELESDWNENMMLCYLAIWWFHPPQENWQNHHKSPL